MQQNLDPLLNRHPKLNCDMIPENLEDRIISITAFKRITLTTLFNTQSFIDEAIKKDAINLHRDIEQMSSSFFKVFKHALSPGDYSLCLFQFFIGFIERKIILYQTNFPEDIEFNSKWNTFKVNIAYMRYENSSELFNSIQSFMVYLNQQLLKIDQSLKANDNEISIWKKWEEIFLKPDLLDFEIAHLANKVQNVYKREHTERFDVVRLSVIELHGSYTGLLNRLTNDLPWLFNELDALVDLLAEKDPNPAFICIKSLKEFYELHKKIIPSKISKLHIGQIKDYPSIYAQVDALPLLKEDFNGATNYDINFSDERYTLMFLDNIHEYIVSENKYDADHVYDFDDYANHKVENLFISCNKKYGKFTLEMMHHTRECLLIKQKCHILIDTFFSNPLCNLHRIYDSLSQWSANSSNLKAITEYHAIESKKSREAPKSINELLAFIEGDNPKQNSPSKNRRQKKLIKPQQNQQSQKIQQVQKSALISIKDSSISSQTCQRIAPLQQKAKIQQQQIIAIPKMTITKEICTSSSWEPIELISKRLKQLLNQESNPFAHHSYPKLALRQALMYAEDLMLSYRNLHKKPNSTYSNVKANSDVVQLCYSLMEQLLRYHNNIKTFPFDPSFEYHGHNLKYLIHESPCEIKIDTSIAKELYLGNFWTSYPFAQMNVWQELDKNLEVEIPKPLKEFHDTIASMKVNLPSLLLYAEKTAVFSIALISTLVKDESISNISKRQDCSFPINHRIDVKHIATLFEHCEQLLAHVKSKSNHPSKIHLQQARHAFLMLQEVLSILNTDAISADEFSFSLRGAFYWQNAALESLLKSISSIQTYSDCFDHDLAKLSQSIAWKDKITESELLMLQTDWKLVNKFSRYPFQYSEAISDTHELILQAEFIRELPDYGLGFKHVTADKYLTTAINFIPITHKEISADQLLGKLDLKLQAVWVFLIKRVMPQLEIECKRL